MTEATAEQRRRRILDAAVDCFAERGLHATTMQDICRRADTSPGAVYSWYPSKESIIDAIAAERHEHEIHLLATALADPDPRTALHSFLDAYFEWLSDPSERLRRRVSVQVWAESLVNDRLQPTVQEGIGQRSLAWDGIRAAQAAGAVTTAADADGMARLVLAVLQGFILQQAWEPDIDIEGYRRAANLVVDALAPPPGP
ncbi:TetR/AcrR family transcriptional regulator [Nocardia sp. NPDC020380]|uniref:TetR/AcrR family transcriptional regulator n=1 Tax=Nocardia sp. NPDC020380 TaxID=3364309 RepID=UPI0037B85965